MAAFLIRFSLSPTVVGLSNGRDIRVQTGGDQTIPLRVGIGYDSHRLVAGRPLILGGVRIPFERGCLGHSDGDVVLHAVADALLGASGLGDIGELFPDTDPAYKDADSGALLREVSGRLQQAGFAIANVDIVVHAERPKLSAYKADMARRVAELLELPADRVNVKAKTNEGLGDVGEGRAIACTAAALLTQLGKS